MPGILSINHVGTCFRQVLCLYFRHDMQKWARWMQVPRLHSAPEASTCITTIEPQRSSCRMSHCGNKLKFCVLRPHESSHIFETLPWKTFDLACSIQSFCFSPCFFNTKLNGFLVKTSTDQTPRSLLNLAPPKSCWGRNFRWCFSSGITRRSSLNINPTAHAKGASFSMIDVLGTNRNWGLAKLICRNFVLRPFLLMLFTVGF